MAYESIRFSLSLAAESDMTEKQYNAVKVSNPYKADIATSAAEAVGIVTNNPKTGFGATIAIEGVTKIAVASGAKVTAGKGVAITAGKASGDGGFGIMLETATGPCLATILLKNGNSAAGASLGK